MSRSFVDPQCATVSMLCSAFAVRIVARKKSASTGSDTRSRQKLQPSVEFRRAHWGFARAKLCPGSAKPGPGNTRWHGDRAKCAGGAVPMLGGACKLPIGAGTPPVALTRPQVAQRMGELGRRMCKLGGRIGGLGLRFCQFGARIFTNDISAFTSSNLASGDMLGICGVWAEIERSKPSR